MDVEVRRARDDRGKAVGRASDCTELSDVLRLAKMWQTRAGGSIDVYWFEQNLGLPHDMVDVSQRCGAPASVYPVLIALVEQRQPPAHGSGTTSCSM